MNTITIDDYQRLPADKRRDLDAWLARWFPCDRHDRLSTPTMYRDCLPIRTLTVHDDGTVEAEVLTDEIRDEEVVTRTVTACPSSPPPV